MTIEQISDYFGIGKTTFHQMKKDNSRIDELYKKGKAKGIKKATGLLWAKMNQGDTASIIFYLKTQAGWNEKSYLEVTKEVLEPPHFVFHIVDPKTGEEKPLNEYNEENQISHE